MGPIKQGRKVRRRKSLIHIKEDHCGYIDAFT